MALSLEHYPLLHWETLQEMEEDLEESFADVIASYLQDLEAKRDLLGQLREREEWRQIGRTAHSLKSSSATLGALKVAEGCRQLEGMLHEDPIPTQSVASAAAELMAVIAATRTALQQR